MRGPVIISPALLIQLYVKYLLFYLTTPYKLYEKATELFNNFNSLISIQKLNCKFRSPPACLPGEDSPVSCEEVAGNASETIWTLSRRDLMPPSEIETSFHGGVARSPINIQKKHFGLIKNNSHVKNK
jgi:hypothetical protein